MLLPGSIKQCSSSINGQGFIRKKCNEHDLLWNEKTTLYISSASLEKKGFLWKTNFKISSLTVVLTLPHWLSCAWENEAIHGFKKGFFNVYHQVSLIFICLYAIPFCLTSGMFRNYRFSDIGDSLRTLLTKPLHLKSLLSFRWRKRNLFMVVVVLLLLFFPQMFSNQSPIRCIVSQSILQKYSDIMRKKHGIYCFSIWVWEMRYCFQLFIIKQYKCLVIPFCTLCNANMSVAIWHS